MHGCGKVQVSDSLDTDTSTRLSTSFAEGTELFRSSTEKNVLSVCSVYPARSIGLN